MRSLFTPRTLLRHSFMAMGTDVQMTLAPRRRHQIRQARAALAEVQQLVLEFGHDGFAVPWLIHINEVNDDDPAQIAQP